MKKKIEQFISHFLSPFIDGEEVLPIERSEHHVPIKGTNIFMVPPDTFEPSKNFKGFQNPTDPTSMIMVTEVPGPYSEITKGFKAEMLKERGMELLSKKEIKVTGFEGMLVELDQPANGMIFSKLILIYGNEKASTIINGIYLKEATELGARIKKSILTSFIDSEWKKNPRIALGYAIREHVGDLKFHSVFGNGMLFNRDLKTPTESVDKATLIADKSFAKVAVEDYRLFCTNRLEQYPGDYEVIESKGINEIEIDRLEGFELFAKNKADEQEEMYQVILFNKKGGYYLFVGTYLATSEKAIADIKKVIWTFTKK